MNEIDLIYTGPSYLNLEQEIGEGYFKLTDYFLDEDEYPGYYRALGKILDTNHDTIGNVALYKYHDVYQDDRELNVMVHEEINVKGDVEKILSLKKGGVVQLA